MVIDWRAPVSQPFYRASKKDPLDVGLRRRFGYTGGELTAYEDEHLSDPTEAARTSKLLQAEIERPRVGPMRDIVATIQPEQDEIVRVGLGGTVCVQGGPGTGKTAVGLHRVAYLLYAHRERLARTGTLVIGPNRSFLHYIEQVLPALGELEVKQATVDDLVAAHVEVRGTDAAAAAVVKGDARMARGAAAGGPFARDAADGAGDGGARFAALAGTRVRTGGDGHGVAGPRHPVRRRPRGASAAHRARRAGTDGAGGRGPGRPGAGRGGPQPRGEGGREGDLAAVDPAKLVLRLLSDAGVPGRARGRAARPRTSRRRSCGRSRPGA